MARVDDAELTIPMAPSPPGAALNWQVQPFALRQWGEQSVVLDESTGAIHLIASASGRLLLDLAQGLSPNAQAQDPDACHEPLAELERLGLIRRDTPTA
jgi:hypothetical protein